MTKEEARNELVLWRNRNSDNGYHYKFVEALTIAIKALEQQPVLDKIRAEIEQIVKPDELGCRGNGKSIRYGLCIALDIIDKYKAERSDSE
jgi:hypothetical protein